MATPTRDVGPRRGGTMVLRRPRTLHDSESRRAWPVWHHRGMSLPETILIIIGDELLGGFTTDVNGAVAARRLFEAGYPVRRIEMVGDSVDDIATTVRRAVEDPSAARVIVSGGIGPAPDDRTHAAVAKALGRELVEDPAALRQIEAMVAPMYAAGGVASPVPTAANRRMARMAAGGRILDNRRGMAPPLAILLEAAPAAGAETRRDGPPAAGAPASPGSGRPGAEGRVEEVRGRWLFVLPGVPREFQAVLEEVLIPEYFSGSRALTVVETRHPGAIERSEEHTS